jgi:hypothetical protein
MRLPTLPILDKEQRPSYHTEQVQEVALETLKRVRLRCVKERTAEEQDTTCSGSFDAIRRWGPMQIFYLGTLNPQSSGPDFFRTGGVGTGTSNITSDHRRYEAGLRSDMIVMMETVVVKVEAPKLRLLRRLRWSLRG